MTTKNATVVLPTVKNEQDVLVELKLDKKEKLSIKDLETIGRASKKASLALRKADPTAANALYYINYRNQKLITKMRKAAKRNPVKK